MIRKTFAWVLVAGLAGAAAFAQTADELVEKSIQASGGREKIEAVKSARMTGKMSMGQGMEAPMVIETVEPNKFRMEMTFQGMTMIQAYDGKSGWQVQPFMGKTEPELMNEQEQKAMEDQIDDMDLFTKYKEKGHTVELVGKEELEGSPVYKLKLTKKNGDVANLYLDAETYLLVKQTGKTKMQGQEIESETSLSDYKEVAGVLYPHSIQTKIPSMPGGVMAMTFEKIEPNPDIPASRFDMPPKKEAAAPPKP
ncbi:MAG TPA: outer membrane lipoprotein-sorting protein [Thermoanaerobaculia bacterium]|nr:outer membrane lipoprotein-sorting protein [Thermoanaerobaculia bacterium]